MNELMKNIMKERKKGEKAEWINEKSNERMEERRKNEWINEKN